MKKDSLFNIEHESSLSPMYLMTLRWHFWSIAAIFVLVVSVVAAWSFNETPIYRATSQILVQSSDPNILSFEKITERERQTPEYIATHSKLIQGEVVIREVVKSLELDEKIGFGIPFDENELNALLRSSMQYIRSLLPLRLKTMKTSEENNISRQDLAINAVRGHLQVFPIRGTGLVKIQFEDPNPRVAAMVVNSLAMHYLELEGNFRVNIGKKASAYLGNEIDKARENLEISVQALQGFKEKNKYIPLGTGQNTVIQKLSQISTVLTKDKTDRINFENTAQKIKDANGNIDILLSLPPFVENSVLQRMRENEIILHRRYLDLSKRYKERHPKLIRAFTELQLMKVKISEEVKRVANSILTQYQATLIREKSLRKSFQEQQNELQRLNRLDVKFNALKRIADTNRDIYQNLLRRFKETSLLGRFKNSRIRISEIAKEPKNPVRPKKLFNILFAMIVSLLIGVGYAFTVENFNKGFRTPREVEIISENSTIGTVPELGKKIGKEDPLFRGVTTKQTIARETFRGIAMMAISRIGSSRKVIQITSSIPNEGKTLLAANLAIGMATFNKKVLIIDGDIKLQGLSDVFNSEFSDGLVQVLQGKVDLLKAIQYFPHSNLSYLPAGFFRGDVSTLLGESDIRSMINSVREQFEYIIIDTAPLLAVSHPLIWSQYADGVFFVVDMKQSNRNMLRQSLELLDGINAPVLGNILNRLPKSLDGHYYGYGTKYHNYYRNGEEA